MTVIVSLIGASEAFAVTEEVTRRALECLESCGLSAAEQRILAPGVAWECLVRGHDGANLAAALRETVGEGIDVNLISAPSVDSALDDPERRMRLLIADMDSTIVVGETLDELAVYAGLGEEIAAVTARAMNGELDFEEALRARVARLRDLPEAAIDRVLEQLAITPGAASLVRSMRASGAYTALVSGGFKQFTSRVRDRLGFDFDQANTLIIADGKLDGTVGEPILGRGAKLETLSVLAKEHDAPLARCIAIGDGANDLDMLRAAGMGVAFRAKPTVAAEARLRVDHGDLTAPLYLQGFTRAEIA